MTSRELAAQVQSKGRSHLLFLMEQTRCSDWQALYEKAAEIHGWDGEEPNVYGTRSGVETCCLPCYYNGSSTPYFAIPLSQSIGTQDDIAKEVAEQLAE